jgi:D-alanine--poly(phosphoribitol) ligase subunit 1
VPLHFDVSVQDIYLSMATGATLIIIPERYFSFPAELMEFIAQRGVSFVCWVPSMLVNIANRDVLATADMRALRFVTVCGEVMPTRHFKQWANHAPTARLFNLYGPTETAIASAYYELESDIEDAAPLPIGAPCRNTHILILDEQGSPVIKGSMGELCIRGSGLGLGYWNAPEATRSAYAPNPTHDHYPETIYRTGDLGYLNDKGQIIYIGRKDSQIKYLGYRIELGEIERAALQVDGVEHACVLYDAGTQQIALFYCGPQPLKARDLRRQLLRHLPKYMLPTKCNHLTALPLNANGKIDRKQLRESIAQDECRQFSA